jgi:hypothetical protein
MLLRVPNAPFTVDVTVHVSGDEAVLAMGGVGPDAETFTLKKK